MTTEKYVKWLDKTRIYRQAYEISGAAAGFVDEDTAAREAQAEFEDDINE